MAQITIYLDDDVLAQIQTAAKAAGVSKRQWIAETVRLRLYNEWPDSVRILAGAWPDFPTADEIRRQQQPDVKREEL